jgi:hypothetical protein
LLLLLLIGIWSKQGVCWWWGWWRIEGRILRRSASKELHQTLLWHYGWHTKPSTDPIFIENGLAEDEKWTSDLPFCEITISKNNENIMDEWNARANLAPERDNRITPNPLDLLRMIYQSIHWSNFHWKRIGRRRETDERHTLLRNHKNKNNFKTSIIYIESH